MTETEFTAEIEQYVVLKLTLADYDDRDRSLPAEFTLAGHKERRRFVDDERRLLQMYFDGWEEPFKKKLKGWRKNSPFYVLDGDRLVAGVYLCDKNKFKDPGPWGQLHFAFMDPEYKGRRIYSAMFEAVVKRSREWGLEGLYLNSDRHLLPEVYERWGAVRWRGSDKGAPKPPKRPKSLWQKLRRAVGIK